MNERAWFTLRQINSIGFNYTRTEMRKMVRMGLYEMKKHRTRHGQVVNMYRAIVDMEDTNE